MKVPLFATSKNVNYLPNVLSKLEAEEKGAFASILVDDDGYVAEGPNVKVGFVTREKELIFSFINKILSGCTAKRLLELATKLVENGRLKSVTIGYITVEEAKQSADMMYIGSTLPVLPIIEWEEKPIGDDK
ncbi:putative aminodeoxychorismate lyase, D-amino-acid transaminase [Helianthus anomalus]